jgi:hypothetical protein
MVGMVPLGRGLSRAHGYCDRHASGGATVMRHFLRLAFAPGALPSRVRTRSAVAALVALAGTAQRLAPALRSTAAGAVHVAPVAAAADLHLLPATGTVVQPMRRFGHPDARSTGDWTTSCITGIKAMQTRAWRAPACRRPGVLFRNVPGPSLLWAAGREDSVGRALRSPLLFRRLRT